jgi:hypothetical protein
MIDRVEIGYTKGDNFLAESIPIPAVDRILKVILKDDADCGINPSEDVVKVVSIQNLKRWYDSF